MPKDSSQVIPYDNLTSILQYISALFFDNPMSCIKNFPETYIDLNINANINQLYV